jgi:hypothetical protein
MAADHPNWFAEMEATLSAAAALGTTRHELSVEPPAREAAIQDVETTLGRRLPADLRVHFAQSFGLLDFRWHLKGDLDVPAPFATWGWCHIALDRLVDVETRRLDWIKAAFPNPADPYDAVWHNKFAFLDVKNGDLLAVDTADDSSRAVVYLSHDDARCHGATLAPTFPEFMRRWSEIGCQGPEAWCIEPYLASDGIDPDGSNAIKWRRWFGLR